MKRLLPVILLISLLLLSCGKNTDAPGPAEEGLRVARLNEAENGLIYLSYSTKEGGSTTDLIDGMLSVMRSEKENGHAVLRAGADVMEYTLESGQLNLIMESSYKELPPAGEILIRAALVRTLSQLKGVDGVCILPGGEPLTDAEGNAVGSLNADSFLIESEDENVFELTLYFANEKGDKLRSERRMVSCDSFTSKERLVVEQLIAGAQGGDVRSCIPPQTRILSVSVSDGICYVNLDSGFLEADSSYTPQVSIYSVVNSLAELGNVYRVQFMVNGESRLMYREIMDLQNSYTRNLDIVE